MRLSDPDGAELVPIEDRLELEESKNYFLALPVQASLPEAWLGERALAYDPDKGGFAIPVGHWVGSLPLRVRTEGAERQLRVEVRPRSEKLPASLWLSLLSELETHLAGITPGREAPEQALGLGAQGASAPMAASALGPLVPEFIRALRTVVASPRERRTEVEEDLPLHQVRRVERDALAYLARHSEAYATVRGEAPPTRGGQPHRIPQRIPVDDLEHPVNRYMAYLMLRTVARLREVGGALARDAGHPDSKPEAAAWYRARAETLLQGATTIERLRVHSFLREVKPAPAGEAALLALHNDPVYARVHALGRVFLSARYSYSSAQAARPVSARPSYELYELWTFFAVKDLLARALPQASWSAQDLDALKLWGGTGAGATWAADLGEQGKLTLHFNLTFPSYLHRHSSSRYSLSKERRPDLVATWDTEVGSRAWVGLDAKYRVAPDALADALESAHLYRDALIWERYGGRNRGTLLLAPGKIEASSPWYEQSFRERFGLGVVRLTPGDRASRDLVDWVLTRLGLGALENVGG